MLGSVALAAWSLARFLNLAACGALTFRCGMTRCASTFIIRPTLRIAFRIGCRTEHCLHLESLEDGVHKIVREVQMMSR